jgi:hypothetical protein
VETRGTKARNAPRRSLLVCDLDELSMDSMSNRTPLSFAWTIPLK